MITVLALNPCVDRTLTVDGFTYGGTNRIESVQNDVAGKGANVCLALNNLGEKCLCLGFNFTGSGAALTDLLDGENISRDLLDVDGPLRTNIKIFDKKTGVMSDLNETGSYVPADHMPALIARVERYLPGSSLLVLSGSVPPGFPKDIYRVLAQKAAAFGVKTVIDAYGELLLEGIKGRPYLIKPNIHELEEAVNEKVETPRDAVRVARGLIARGVGLVCVSMGKRGAVLVSGDKAYYSQGADIQVKGVQGSGDALVAGMGIATVRGLPLPEVLRYGMAVAHGSLLLGGTQMCTQGTFRQMFPLMPVEEITP